MLGLYKIQMASSIPSRVRALMLLINDGQTDNQSETEGAVDNTPLAKYVRGVKRDISIKKIQIILLADLFSMLFAAYVFLDLFSLYIHKESPVHGSLSDSSLFLLLTLDTRVNVRHGRHSLYLMTQNSTCCNIFLFIYLFILYIFYFQVIFTQDSSPQCYKLCSPSKSC